MYQAICRKTSACALLDNLAHRILATTFLVFLSVMGMPEAAWSVEQELLVSSSNISISSNALILPVEVVLVDAQTANRTGELPDVYEAFGLRSIRGVVVGPDGDIYVAARLSSGGSDSQGQVLRYDGNTLEFKSRFVEPGAGGLRSPEGIAFGPDGNLYVVNHDHASVLRFDGSSGVFIDVFVTPGSGGLNDPYGIKFGPDGNLYVASGGSDSVLRYEPQGGNYLGVAADVSTNGYISPRGVGFGPAGELFVATITGTTPRFGIIAEYHPTNAGFLREFAVLSQGLNATGQIIGDLGSDAAGNLLVGDVVGDMVRRFDPTTANELGLAASFVERPRYFALRDLDIMTIDSDMLTITGDGDDNPNAIYGQSYSTEIVDGQANFYIPGDVEFDASTIRGVGSNGIVLHIGNNAIIADGVLFDVAARQAQAGPGGGAGGEAGIRGFGGAIGRTGAGNNPVAIRGCTGTPAVGLAHDDPSAPGCGGTGDHEVVYGGMNGNAGVAGNRSLDFGESPVIGTPAGGSPGGDGESGGAGGNGGFGINNSGLAALGGAPGVAGAGGAAGPAGGGGGSGKGAASSIIINAGNGAPGGAGAPGGPGQDGEHGTVAAVGAPGLHPYVEGVLSGGNGGGAGGGGGGGGGAGAGGNGGNGGGGGGGGSTTVAVFNMVLDGGHGGAGGVGGRGASGSAGGGGSDGAPGGGGGGVLELRVAGELTIGDSSFDASGAAGMFPDTGRDPGAPGSPVAGSRGGTGTTPEDFAENDGGDGGKGGNGGHGGAGGQGGFGGTGGLSGPGAGGMISLQAASVVGSRVAVMTNAGMRTEGSLPSAEDGHVIVGSNVDYPAVQSTASAALEVRGTGDSSPFIADGVFVSNIMNLPGGADVYGLTGLSSAAVPGIGGAPADAVAAIVRMDVGPSGLDDDYRDQDMLLLVNLSNTAIDNPELGIGGGYQTRLLQRGYANLPEFGGNGALPLNSLAAGEVYAILVPDDAVVASFSGSVGGTNYVIADATLAKGDVAFSKPAATGGNGGNGGNGNVGGSSGGGGSISWWALLLIASGLGYRSRLNRCCGVSNFQ